MPLGQRGHVQSPLSVQLDVLRHVGAEVVRAHERTLHATPAQQEPRVDAELAADADDGGQAARPQHLHRLLAGLLQPQTLERIVDPAAGQVGDLLDRIPL